MRLCHSPEHSAARSTFSIHFPAPSRRSFLIPPTSGLLALARAHGVGCVADPHRLSDPLRHCFALRRSATVALFSPLIACVVRCVVSTSSAAWRCPTKGWRSFEAATTKPWSWSPSRSTSSRKQSPQLTSSSNRPPSRLVCEAEMGRLFPCRPGLDFRCLGSACVMNLWVHNRLLPSRLPSTGQEPLSQQATSHQVQNSLWSVSSSLHPVSICPRSIFFSLHSLPLG